MMIETHTHGTHTAAATPVKEASAPVVASEDKKLAKNAKTKKVEAVIAERKAKKVTKKK
jgi:glyoxylase-like metal-dependent hydrolase (beta-lactamase superfamily II)